MSADWFSQRYTSRCPTVRRIRPNSLWEVIAINIAWPLGLGLFVAGLATQQPFDALQGLAFFFAVVLYALVRIYQLSQIDWIAEAT
jgi:hypothetical protein